jgi:hypothetical protein|tara:strand:+ start:97 stop:351 length:255 start_codon:yes stop_codon:yes gene_type:complete
MTFVEPTLMARQFEDALINPNTGLLSKIEGSETRAGKDLGTHILEVLLNLMVAGTQHDGLHFEVPQQYNKHAPVIALTDSVALC